MKVWFGLLFAVSFGLCIRSLKDAFKGPETGDWWKFESLVDKQEREKDFEEFVVNLRLTLNKGRIEDHSKRLEWRNAILMDGLMESREYLHLATFVENIHEKVHTFEQFFTTGTKMLETLGNGGVDMLSNFVTMVMKSRGTILEIQKHYSLYQSEASRQTALVSECEMILEGLWSRLQQGEDTGHLQVAQEVLLWKANFETRHDELVESVKSYVASTGGWLQDTLGDELEIEGMPLAHLVADGEDALEVLEAARELVRAYKAMFDSRVNETQVLEQHSEL